VLQITVVTAVWGGEIGTHDIRYCRRVRDGVHEQSHKQETLLKTRAVILPEEIHSESSDLNKQCFVLCTHGLGVLFSDKLFKLPSVSFDLRTWIG